MGVFRAEIAKLTTLRTPVIVAVVTALGTILGVWAFTAAVQRTINSGRAADLSGLVDSSSAVWMVLGYGNVGVILLGAWMMYQEQGNGNLRTTVLSAPRRVSLFLTKAGVVLIASFVVAAVAAFGSYGARFLLVGAVPLIADGTSDIRVLLGVILYWALIGVLTFAVSAIVRNGLVGMGIMLALVLALSQYLYRVTDLARFLPDQAGVQMYQPLEAGELGPGLGLVVLCAWVAAALIVGALSFRTWAVRS